MSKEFPSAFVVIKSSFEIVLFVRSKAGAGTGLHLAGRDLVDLAAVVKLCCWQNTVHSASLQVLVNSNRGLAPSVKLVVAFYGRDVVVVAHIATALDTLM